MDRSGSYKKGRRRSKAEVKIFGKNELIYPKLDEIQRLATEERGLPPSDRDKVIICEVKGHMYERHVTHWYNQSPSMNPDHLPKHQTISVQEYYCLRCGRYKWTACQYTAMNACDDSPPISE